MVRDRLGGHDIIVMPKPAAAGVGRAALRASIDRQWELLARRGPGSAHNRRPDEGPE